MADFCFCIYGTWYFLETSYNIEECKGENEALQKVILLQNEFEFKMILIHPFRWGGVTFVLNLITNSTR